MSSEARALSTETGGVAEPQAWCVDLWTPLPFVDPARVGSTLAYEQRTVLFPSTEAVLPEASGTRKQRFLMFALTPGPLVGLTRADGTLAQGTVNAPSIGDAAGASEQHPGLSFLAASTPQPLVGLVRAGGTLACAQGAVNAPSIGDTAGASEQRPGPCFLTASTPQPRVGLARVSGTLSLVRDTVRAPSMWWDSQGAGGDSRALEWRPGPLGSSLAALILQLPAGGTPARALSTAPSSPRRPVNQI